MRNGGLKFTRKKKGKSKYFNLIGAAHPSHAPQPSTYEKKVTKKCCFLTNFVSNFFKFFFLGHSGVDELTDPLSHDFLVAPPWFIHCLTGAYAWSVGVFQLTWCGLAGLECIWGSVLRGKPSCTWGISKGAEVGCGKHNSQIDEELRVGYNASVGTVQGLATAWEWVGLVKRDMSVVGWVLNGMQHMRGCWKGRVEAK